MLAFLAQPPCSLWPLAWIAPAPWICLIARETLGGKRAYFAVWLAGLAYWLAALNSLTRPHWLTAIGWGVLSAYLGCYLLAFVVIGRLAVKRCRLPLAIAAPVVWTGLEFAQTHILDGFNFASLGHSQRPWLQVIQIADLGGAYAVSALVMLVATCVALAWLPGKGSRWLRLAPGLVGLAAAIIYGQVRLSQSGGPAGPKIALIQGSIDTRFDRPAKPPDIMRHYRTLTDEAIQNHADLDLIVWPEGQWQGILAEFSPAASPPPGDREDLIEEMRKFDRESRRQLELLARKLQVKTLFGLTAVEFGAGERQSYNSAVLVDPITGVGERYDKRTLVMFGEYVPYADVLPFLRKLTPVNDETTPGRRLPAWQVGQAKLAGTICFESSLPQRVRNNVLELRERDEEPDILVNVTNDGWFFGTSALDLHLACGVFRAIECRKPLVIAANTGFSASIDANGRIRQIGPRREPAVVVDQVQLDDRSSIYLDWGDFFAQTCAASIVMILVGTTVSRQFRRHVPVANGPNPEALEKST